jgi:hypothetical protein
MSMIHACAEETFDGLLWHSTCRHEYTVGGNYHIQNRKKRGVVTAVAPPTPHCNVFTIDMTPERDYTNTFMLDFVEAGDENPPGDGRFIYAENMRHMLVAFRRPPGKSQDHAAPYNKHIIFQEGGGRIASGLAKSVKGRVTFVPIAAVYRSDAPGKFHL